MGQATSWFGSVFIYAIAVEQFAASLVFLSSGSYNRAIFWACLAGANLCVAGMK